MNIAVVGASGYVGSNLIQKLSDNTNYNIIGIAPDIKNKNEKNIIYKKASVLDSKSISEALTNCDVAFYLVHMMAQHEMDYADAESQAAKIFAEAAKKAGVKKIIYLGGLGNDNDNLSKHLKSRHKTGDIMRSIHDCVIEFRASMVIGDGSISFDILKNLVNKLPILTLPKWSKTLTQPIALPDLLEYLKGALELPLNSEIIEIGGPNSYSYGDLMRIYAKSEGKKRIFVGLPFIPTAVAAWWLNLFTPPKHAKVGRAMAESLAYPMLVTNDKSIELFPNIRPMTIGKFLRDMK